MKIKKDILLLTSLLFTTTFINFPIISHATDLSEMVLTGVGGSGEDSFDAVAHTLDGGVVAVGYTNSNDNGLSSNGDFDALITKYDPFGKVEWMKTLGGSKLDKFHAVTAISDGGYIAVGQSASTDIGLTNNGSTDAIVLNYSPLKWQDSWSIGLSPQVYPSYGGSSNLSGYQN